MEYEHEVNALVTVGEDTRLLSVLERREHWYTVSDEQQSIAMYKLSDGEEYPATLVKPLGDGPLTLQISIPSEGKSQAEIDADIDKLKGIIGDILEAAGMPRDSVKEVSREFVDDGV